MTPKTADLRFAGGMNNKAQESAIPLTGRETLGQARRILNMDVLDDGTLSKRSGLELAITAPGARSLWSCNVGTFFATDDGLYQIDHAMQANQLFVGDPGDPVSYAEVNGDVYWSSRIAQGKIVNGQNQAWNPGRHGEIVRYYHGRIYLVSGNIAFPTDSYRFDRIDPFRNFMGFPAQVVMFEPVEGGIFVGCRDAGVYYLAGQDYAAGFNMRHIDASWCVPGSSMRAPGKSFGTSSDVAVWLSSVGWMVGLPGGEVRRLQDRSIVLPEYGSGASLLRETNGIRQLLCVATGDVEMASAGAMDTVTTEVIRRGRVVA